MTLTGWQSGLLTSIYNEVTLQRSHPPQEIVRFKVLHLLAIWEGEAPAELLRHRSAGASPSRPMNLQVPKPDDLPREGG